MRASIDFLLRIHSGTLEIAPSLLSQCDTNSKNCHINISASQALRYVRERCTGHAKASLAQLDWDDSLARIVWTTRSSDNSHVGFVWAGEENKVICLEDS